MDQAIFTESVTIGLADGQREALHESARRQGVMASELVRRAIQAVIDGPAPSGPQDPVGDGG